MDDPKPITEAQLKLMKPMVRLFSHWNAWVYRLSGGRMMNRFGGGQVCLVSMRGAKSGNLKDVPLMYVPYRDGVILVASLAGSPRHPAWYYNLVAHPEITVTVGETAMQLVARQATEAEKAEVWPLCCEHYKDFDLYQRRTARNIPVFICQPAEA